MVSFSCLSQDDVVFSFLPILTVNPDLFWKLAYNLSEISRSQICIFELFLTIFIYCVSCLFYFYQKYLPVSSITKTAENFFIILCCFSTICFKVLKQTYYFFLTITLSRCQMSSTYSWIVLSDVNLPLHAVLRSAFLAQPFSSLYAASTRFCASA